MKRYVELKYEGKTYKKEYDINKILSEKNFFWFFETEVENLRLEILKDTLIINGGIWYNGTFEYGVIRDIDWRAGIFENGVIYNGVFKKITVGKGIIFAGTFLKGDVLFADIRGGNFEDVNISSNVNTIQAKSQPNNNSEQQPISVQNTAKPVQNSNIQIPEVATEHKLYKFEDFIKSVNN